MNRSLFPRLLLSYLAPLLLAPAFGADALVPVGVARMDVTPDYPVRLSGYGVRRAESAGVEQRIFAKALAIGGDATGAAVIITVDNCGVPAEMREEVAARLAKKAKLANDRFTIASSHSHSAPMLRGVLLNLFSMDIPPEHLPAIDRYTRELTDKLEQVALAALADRRPATLAWTQGSAQFARNRRTPGGPVDHSLPALVVRDDASKLRAVLVNYACHCTTLGGDFNRVCGDWAGCAQEFIERDHPGAIALMAIGCGADANPFPRPGFDVAKKHGEEIAAEVKRLLGGELKPITAPLACRTKRLELPFDTLPTRAAMEQTIATNKSTPIVYAAKKNLARLDRGEKLPMHLPYLVQTWNFGGDLAMVFLPGEVVVDYALRLKQEFDPRRMWVTAYANAVPCYIPSRRILTEGGYEGGGAMVYYDRPTRLAAVVEDLIVGAVRELLPKEFVRTEKQADFPPPLSPHESIGQMRTKPGFTIELVAAEPLIESPVAIDWGADGRLWVVEMFDYPTGVDRNWKPGGRVKVLTSTKGDGYYDQATVFLDGLPFPTGVMAWRKGVLICAAPDILYAEDTDGDGKADKVTKLFSGFVTDNFQARVNGLSYGLDNWIYGANGLRGGVITNLVAADVRRLSSKAREGQSLVTSAATLNIRNQDFRFHPDTGALESVSGLSQQGRVRDDFGNWFGSHNSTLLMHFPFPDHYLRRNPHVPAPNPVVTVPFDTDPNRLYPISRTLTRFNSPDSANRTTSACGQGIYRDDLLGTNFYGNAFTCEPVHNLVHRLRLEPAGVTFSGFRPDDERASEFLASADSWFRPVQARTGPDGALWIVDMYRFLIEHPRWVTPDRLAEIDVRAGADKGRIFRVYPRGQKLRPSVDLTKLEWPQLVAALATANGTTRDLVQTELVQRAHKIPVTPSREGLVKLAAEHPLPAVRVQALCTLGGMRQLVPTVLRMALADANACVRREAVRLCEAPLLLASKASLPASREHKDMEAALLKLADDVAPGVRLQLAFLLGEWNDPRAGAALGKIARSGVEDGFLRAAVVTAAAREPVEILKAVLAAPREQAGRNELVAQLTTTAAAVAREDAEATGRLLATLGLKAGQPLEAWQLVAFDGFLSAYERRQSKAASPQASEVRATLAGICEAARQVAVRATEDEATREAAVRLLAREEQPEKNLSLLAKLLQPPASLKLQQAALDTLGRIASPQVPALLLADWTRRPPSQRTAVLNVLLSRDTWQAGLLDAVEKSIVSPGDVPAASRQRLAKSASQPVRERAAKLLPLARAETRAVALAKFQGVAGLKGDAVKGGALYEKHCAACHKLLGHGHDVGPVLTPLRDKSVQDFLVAILDPNAAVEPRFTAYLVETKDGRSFSGVITGETATSLVVVQAGGIRETVLRTEIESLRATELSLMPEGMEEAITPQELADLIAWIRVGK